MQHEKLMNMKIAWFVGINSNEWMRIQSGTKICGQTVEININEI